ncbi:MAG TPA: tetratricopeptide repeat protein [Actinophytocola sp.]|nr:tetratricopeptide repeat protein [Actinophytocola sp.]
MSLDGEVWDEVRMQPAMHRTVVVFDVAGFGDHSRTNEHQVRVRDGLYGAVERAFADIGLSWAECYHEDRGDGVFVLAPAEVPKAVFVEELPGRLVAALRAHNSGRAPQEQIRLRMALHAGEIRQDAHGVTGTPINLAFRLLDAAPLKAALAGSTGVLAIIASAWFFDEVISNSTASSPAGYWSVRVRVKETNVIGWIRLPDQPVRVDVASAVRPNGAAGKATGRQSKRARREAAMARVEMTQTLPRDTTAFTGRERELDRLLSSAEEAVETGQVVAIHAIDGMAGVGKTALAVHVAHRLRDSFPDGQLFLRLHAHTPGQSPADPAEVLASLLSAAGVGAQSIPAELDARAAMWRAHLAGQRVLMILDDAAGHQQVEPLLPSTSGCLVLVTSRRRLTALDTAVTLPLDTLPPDEAMALFTRLSGRTVTESDHEYVADIVESAGNLPLAISLVAGRLRHRQAWSIADLAADLNSTRDRLFEIRAEDVEVAAAFDLSYRDLPARGRRFFRCLGMHPGPVLDAYGAAVLADVPLGTARDYLEALYDDHLLDEPAPGRYRMHDLIRQYTRRLTEWDGDGEIREDIVVYRLLDYYEHTAQVAENHIYGKILVDDLVVQPSDTVVRDFATHAEAMAWMHTERANLVACVEYAARQGQRSRMRELEDALTSLLWVGGVWDQAILLGQSSDSADWQGDEPLSRAYSLNRLGEGRKSTGDFAGSVVAHSEALTIYHELNQPELRKRMATTLSFMGMAQLVVGDVAGARQSQTEALEIFRSLDYPLAEANTLNELGVVLRVAGAYVEALQAHAQALVIFREVGGDSSTAFALVGLGAVHRALGNFSEATSNLRQALALYRKYGSQVGEADALNELGTAIGAMGDFSSADELHAKALTIYQEINHRLGQAETLNNNGWLLLEFGRPGVALEQHRSALELAEGVHSKLEEARALEGIARCGVELGDDVDAAGHLERAGAIYAEIGAAHATARRFEKLDTPSGAPHAGRAGE